MNGQAAVVRSPSGHTLTASRLVTGTHDSDGQGRVLCLVPALGGLPGRETAVIVDDHPA